jgi:hypothetical protein
LVQAALLVQQISEANAAKEEAEATKAELEAALAAKTTECDEAVAAKEATDEKLNMVTAAAAAAAVTAAAEVIYLFFECLLSV